MRCQLRPLYMKVPQSPVSLLQTPLSRGLAKHYWESHLSGVVFMSESDGEAAFDAAAQRLDRALQRLEASTRSLNGRMRSLSRIEAESQRMASDRNRLASELDRTAARARQLDEKANEVSRKLVEAMETIRNVLTAKETV